MMNLHLMNTESMVAITVLGSLILSAAVLTVRALVERKPARQRVEVRRDPR
jgi:hypothetical protein